MPYPVVFIRVSGLTATSIRWKSEVSVNDGGLELAESCSNEIRKGSKKASGACGSGMGRSVCL